MTKDAESSESLRSEIERLRFEVVDTGVGIPADQQSTIFELPLDGPAT